MRFALLLVTALLSSCALAGNFSLSVVKDTRRVIDAGVFGFSDNGFITLDIKAFSLQEQEEMKTVNEKIGFTLDLVTTAAFARQEKNYAKEEGAKKHVCFLDDPVVKPSKRYVFPLQQALAQGQLPEPKTVQIDVPGLYALFFYSCKNYDDDKPMPKPVHTTFTVFVSEYNLNNGKKDYLSLGDSNLPALYGVFTILFLACLVKWHALLRTNRAHTHKIHYLMYCLLILKVFTVGLESVMLSHHQDTGVPSGWDWLFYFFQTLKGIALFTVILLLGTGWSFLKPFLSERDKKILLMLLPLQIIINIAIGVIDETSEGDKNWTTWADTLRVLDVVCCCAVLLPVVWSIKTLKEASSTDGKATRNLMRMQQFRTFYLAVVIFIYFTRIAVVLIEHTLPYKITWIAHFLREAAALLFYVYTGSKFHPTGENPYLHMEVDDAEEIEVEADGPEDEE